ncbi:MAG: hypothetical protein ACI4U3_04255 [Traorella sp.]
MNNVKRIVLIGFLSALLFACEQVLTFLPNIQLTVFLIILYSKVLGWKDSCMIILIHVLLDNFFMGSFNMFFTPIMFLGWAMIPCLLEFVFYRINDSFHLALLSILFSLIYSWLFIIPNSFLYQIDLVAYLMADLPFEFMLAISSFISTLWLYDPCFKVLTKLSQVYKQSNINEG